MRKVLLVLIVLALLVVLPAGAFAAEEANVNFNGEKLSFEVPAQNVNGRVLVPLRAIFEKMGATVDWNPDTETATAKKGDQVVILKINDTKPTVDGKVVEIDQPGVILNGRTLAPLRFVAEAFGGSVEWVSGSNTAFISYRSGSSETKSAGVMTYAEYMAADLDTKVVVETYVQGIQSWWEDKTTLYTQDRDGAYFLYNIACSEEDYAKLKREPRSGLKDTRRSGPA